ncbi:MAG: hypothetical protein GY765_11510 [bacterium]|nr:hypothetical protein [bacterium]
MAGPGEGPGEIKRNIMVNFGFTTDKRLFFTEYFRGHRWMTFLDLTGKYKDVMKFDTGKNSFGVQRAVSLPQSGYLLEFAFIGTSKKEPHYYLQSFPTSLCHVGENGRVISKIKETNFFSSISYLKLGADSSLPFTPHLMWCPYKDNTVIVTDGLDNRLYRLDYRGKTVAEIATALPEPPDVTQKDLRQWRERLKYYSSQTSDKRSRYKKFGKVIEEYTQSLYKKKPYITGISSTPSGNILISGRGSIEGADTKNVLWLLDEKGKTLLKVILSAGTVRVSRNFIFCRARDDEENSVIYCYKRKKDERSDLSQLAKTFSAEGSRSIGEN